MKQLLIGLMGLLWLMPGLSTAQSTHFVCKFDRDCPEISIPPQSKNVWQLGEHYRNSIVYSRTNSSDPKYFEVKIPLGAEKVTYLETVHNFAFYEEMGGYIEVSYDEGVTWQNVLDDSFGKPIGYFYQTSDTLNNGQVGFTGTSNDYVTSTFQWNWGLRKPEMLYLRYVVVPISKGQPMPWWDIKEIAVFGVSF